MKHRYVKACRFRCQKCNAPYKTHKSSEGRKCLLCGGKIVKRVKKR